ncbi:hypothetical protein ACWGR4_39770 [Embleya sp. NPDC055664]|uniref:hypothetical protein n=1 Tax=Embleya sp. NPDC059237 TaxID=3346784 RepID=UPI0036C09604
MDTTGGGGISADIRFRCHGVRINGDHLAESKMAAYAMRRAEVVVRNILAQVRGEAPTATYLPSPEPSILLPLGPTGGAGQ